MQEKGKSICAMIKTIVCSDVNTYFYESMSGEQLQYFQLANFKFIAVIPFFDEL